MKLEHTYFKIVFQIAVGSFSVSSSLDLKWALSAVVTQQIL